MSITLLKPFNLDSSANYTFNKVSVTNSAPSTDTVTGAVVITGGLGVGGNINVGEILHVSSVGNLYVPGGSSGQILSTDGFGNLSWVNQSVMSGLANGTSNLSIPTINGNVILSVGGTPNVLVATSTGVNVSGTANITGNLTAGNVNINSLGNQQIPISYNGTLVGGPDLLWEFDNAALFTTALKSNGYITITGNLTSGNANLGNTATANYFVGNGSQLTGISSTTGNANLANYAAYVIEAAQGNITSLGTLAHLDVSGNITAGNANLGNLVVANFFSGDGSLLSNITGGNVNGDVSGANHANIADTANAVAGANVSGEVAYAATANSVAGGNVSGQVGNALIAGTVYTNAQPNITSVGTLSNLSVAGNITSSNANLGNLVTANYFSGDGSLLTGVQATSGTADTANTVTANAQPNITSVGTLVSLDVSGNLTAGNANLGNLVVANFFSGNGSLLSNISGSNVSEVANANYATYSGHVIAGDQSNITSLGTLVSLSTGDATVTGNLTVNGTTIIANVTSVSVKDPIIEMGGYPNGDPLISNDGKDRGSLLHYYNGGAVDAFMGWDNSNSEFALGSNVSVSSEVVTFNELGNLRAGYFIGNGSRLSSITGSNVSGDVSGANHANIADVANSVAGANVSGQVGNALIAGTVYTNAQPNITSVGTLSSLDVTGNVSSGANLYGKLFSSTNTTLHVPGPGNVTGERVRLYDFNNPSSTNFAIGVEDHYIWNAVDATTAGFKWYAGNAIAATLMGNGQLTAAGNITAANASLGNLVTANFFSGDGSLLTGIQASSGTATTAGTVTANAQPNITSVGTLVSLDISGNLTAGNANLGNLVVANFYSGDGSLLSNITSGNITGQVANALVAGTVYTNAQPNITSVGTLSGLDVSGGVSAQYFLGPLANGQSNVNIPVIDGNVNIVSNGNTSLIVTPTGANITGTLNVTGNANLGNLVVANFFSGDGSLLSNITAGNITGQVANALIAGTVYTNAQPNITSVGTLSNLISNGTVNFANASNVQLGDLGNISILGGQDGQILVTDGSGNLQWVDNTPSTVTYTANSITQTNGVYVTGDVASIQTFGDYADTGGVYTLTDGTGSAPAWIVTVDFLTVANFNRVVMNINYTQASGHTIYVQLYNFNTSLWDNIGTYTGLGSYYGFALEVIDDLNYINSGQVQLRLYHSNGGNALHQTSIDYIALELSNQGPQGPRGPTGATGSTGPGVPTGGTTGQILTKNSGTNYDTSWSSNISISGNVTSGNANLGNLVTANYVNVNETLTANVVTINVSTGTAPLNVSSTTRVANLNVDHSNVSDYSNIVTSTTGTYYPALVSGTSSGNYQLSANSNITYDAATHTLSTDYLGGTLTTNAQPNVTSVGSLSSLIVIGNIDVSNVNVGNQLYVTGNVYAPYFVGDVSGNVVGTFTGDVGAPGSNREVLFNTNDLVDAASGFTFNKDSNTLSVANTIQASNIEISNNLSVTSNIDGGNISGDALLITGNASIVGNLTVSGTTIYANVSTLTIKDPIIDLGGDTTGAPLISDDGKDRGTLLKYHDGTNPVSAFIGWDNSNGEFTLGSNVSVSSEVITFNTLGNVRADRFIGNGSFLSNITGGNVVGEVAYAAVANSVSGSNVSGEVAYAATANSVAGGNVSGEVGYAAVANSVAGGNVSGAVAYATTANSVAGGNVSGQVGNALIAGTVYTNAQPNITSVGTLVSLDISGNITAGNANLGNSVTANFFVGNGSLLTGVQASSGTADTAGTVTGNAQPNITSVGTLISLDVSGNITAGNANLGNLVVANFFSGDGSLLSNITGGNVNGDVSGANHANIADTANAVAGANVSGEVSYAAVANSVAGGNVSGAVSYATTANSVAGANVSGEVAYAAVANSVAGGNVSGDVSGANHANIADVANSVSGSNVTGQVGYAAVANSVSGSNVSGEVSYAAVANSVAGANVSGQVGNALIAGTVYTNAQPNITSVGTLSGIVATGIIDFTAAGNVSLGSNANVHITGGSSGQYLQTDGSGALTWVSPSVGTSIVNGTSNVDIPSSSGNITLSSAGNANIVVVTGTGVNVNGTFNATGVITGNGYGLSALQGSNILGEVAYAATANSVSGSNVSGDVSGADHANVADVANLVAGGNVSGAVAYATTANSVSGSNVSGQVGNALIAGTVYTSAQPNITSLGTLVSLNTGDATITGNLTVNGTTVYANVTTVNVKDPVIELGGYPNGTPLSTDDGKDRGTLLHYYDGGAINAFMGWDNSNSEFGFGSNVSVTNEVITWNNYGNIRASYFIGNGSQLTGLVANANYTVYAGNVVESSQPNITSLGTLVNLTVSGNISSGNANLGNLAYANYLGGTLTTAAQPNITSVGTLTSLDVTGNISASNVSGTLYPTSGNGIAGIIFPSNPGGGTGDTASIKYYAASGQDTILELTVTNNTTDIIKLNASGGTTVTNKLTADYLAGDGGNISNIQGANVSGTVSSATSATTAGTVTTAAQPNITSVGTLSSVTVTANVIAGNIKTDHLLYANGTAYEFTTNAAGSNTQVQFNDGNSFAGNAGLTFDKTNTRLTANNLVTTSTANLGAVGNVTITGGSTGYVLTTDGSGHLSWQAAGGTSIGFTNVAKDDFTGNGVQTTFLLSKTPTGAAAVQVSIDGLVQQSSAFSISGSNVVFSPAPASGAAIEVTTYGVTTLTGSNNQVLFNDAGDVGASSGFTFNKSTNALSVSGNVTSSNANLGNLATANYFSGNGSLLSSITGSNVTGQVGNALIAGTVYTGAQPNITSLGTLTSLTVGPNSSITMSGTTGYIQANSIYGRDGTAALYPYYSSVSGSIGVRTDLTVGTGGTGNLTVNGIANVTGNITSGNANLGNLVTANYITAVLTTGAQPNITSVGTLVGLTSGGIVNFTTASNVSLGANGNVHITGGSSGQYLYTDGAGNLSWGTVSSTGVTNGNSNVSIPVANGNVNISSAGNANIVVVTGTGVNVAGTLNTGSGVITTTGNISAGNANLGNLVTANYTTAVLTTGAQPNITSTGTLTSLTVTGNTTSGNFLTAGNITSSTLISNIATGTAPLTVSSTTRVSNLNVAYANVSDYEVVTTQTSGTFYPVFVNGNTTGNYALASNSLMSFDVANTKLLLGSGTGGNITGANLVSANYFSGNGSLLSSITGSNVTGQVGYAAVANSVSGSNVSGAVAYATTANSVAGSNVSGQVANALIAGTVYTNAQPNITSVGTLTSLTVTANISSGNANLGNLTTSNYFSGNGSLLSSITGSNVTGQVGYAAVANSVAGSNVSGQVTYAATANSVSGSNVSGQVSNALVAGTVYTGAQPNITSTGTLTNLNVSGNAVIGGNLTVNGTVTSINSTIVEIDDLAIVLANDASTSTQANGAGIIINGASANMLYINSTNSFTFSHRISADGGLLSNITGSNVTGQVGYAAVANSVSGSNVSGEVAYAAVANSVAGGNVSGQVGNALIAGTVYTAAQPNITSVGTLVNTTMGSANSLSGGNLVSATYLTGTLTTAAQPNITSTGTLASLTVSANISSGNANLGNLTTSNYFSGNGSLLSSITGANVTGQVGYAAVANSVSGSNVSGEVAYAAVANSVSGSNVSGAVAYATTANSVTGGNVSGQVGNALVAGTVYTNAQPNITSVGTLTSLSVSGNITSSNANLGNLVTANFFSGDGGFLSNIQVGAGTAITNGTSNVAVGLNANVTIGIAGTSSIAVFASTGLYVTGLVSLSGNISSGNANLGNLTTSNYFSGNGSLLSSIAGANVTGQVGYAAVANSVAGSNVSGQVTYAATANSVSGSNVSGQVSNALIAGTVYTAAQPNITSTGTLVNLTVTGNITSGNANLGNLTTSNYFSGNGSLLSSITGSNVTGQVGYAAVANSVSGSNVSGEVAHAAVANSVAGGNVSGQVSNALIAGTVYTNAQPNITSVGTLVSLNVTGNISSGNANLGNLTTSNYFSGNGSLLSSITGANVTGQVGYAAVANSVSGSNVSGEVAYAATANSVSGSNVSGAVAYATTANAVAGSNVSGQVSNALIAGTVYTNAQPNITSVGTLTSLTVSGNITSNNANLGNLVTANYFSGDGGFLSNIQVGAGTAITNGTSNVAVGLNSNVTVGIAGTSGIAVFASTGFYVTGLVSVTGNISSGNANLGNLTTSNYFSGNGSLLSSITGSNVTGQVGYAAVANSVSGSNVSGAVAYATTANSVSGGNVSGAVAYATTANSVSGSNVSGEVAYAAVANSVAGGNVSGQVGNALVAGTVYTAAQPNITSVGTLTSVSVTGDISGANLVLTGNLTVSGTTTSVNSTITRIVDPILELGGGANGAALGSNDGKDRGTLLHYYSSGVKDAFMGWDNSNAEFAFGSDVSLSSEVVTFNSLANVRVNYIIGNGSSLSSLTGSNVTGQVGYAAVANSVSGSNVSGAVAYATTANSVTGSNVSGAVAYATTANSVSGSNVSGEVSYAATANSVAGSNVSGQVSNALVAGTVYTNAQPNITSLGTLSSLTVTANISSGNANLGNLVTANYTTAVLTTGAQPNITSIGSLTGLTVSNATGVVNFTTTANVTLGAVANLHISGGSSGYVLSTDGSGALSWVAQTGGGSTSSISNGTSNVNIATSGGNVVVGVAGNAAIATFTGTGVNVAGTFNTGSGNANVGNLGAAQVLASANITAPQLISNVSTGTAPLTVSSTTRVSNLNVAYANVSDYGAVTAQTTGNFYPVFVSGSSSGNYALAANSLMSFDVGNSQLSVGTGTGGSITGANLISANYVTGTLTTAAQPNITSLGTLATVTHAANANITMSGSLSQLSGANLVSANYLSGNGSLLSSITGSNVTGQVGNALIAGTVYTAAQPNITSVSTSFTGLTFAANGNITMSGSLSQISGANLISGTYLTGTLTTAAQPNITSTGTLSSLTVGPNSSITMSGTTGYIQGNSIYGRDGTAAIYPYYNSVAGSAGVRTDLTVGTGGTGNLSVNGNVSATLVTGTLTTAAQPNITSHGSLTGLTVSNASGVVNFITTANVSLGSVSNLHISGGSAGQFLSTDSFGGLSWASGSGATITDDTTTNATYYPVFATASSGTLSTATISTTKLTYNPSTGTLTAQDLNTLSDVTLKENPEQIQNPMEVLMQLFGMGFNWKNTKKKSYGLMAQMVEKVLPELVNTTPEGVKTVNYIPLIAFLIEAIKKQQEDIDSLKKDK